MGKFVNNTEEFLLIVKKMKLNLLILDLQI